jgi:tRNA 2-selenouridine synthase
MSSPSPVVGIECFLNGATGPIFDVRSPCEYASGHIPGSYSLPLFTDEERAFVGTAYKQRGHDEAVQIGLEAVGPKLGKMANTIREIVHQSKGGSCRVTCYRGGMRSRSVQWLCEFLGFSTVRLDGGYKSYRHHVLDTFARDFRLIVLGGPTGSGKTRWIKLLQQRGFQAIDLEEIANHRGSAFGLLPGLSQPSIEQFENCLAEQLWKMDPHVPIFVEDECRRIGSCVIPKALYDNMDRSQLLWLQVSLEDRLEHILESYGCLPEEWLIECAKKLQQRLGNERVKAVVCAIEKGGKSEAARLLLDYYDQAYLHSRARHPRDHIPVTCQELATLIENNSIEAIFCSQQ